MKIEDMKGWELKAREYAIINNKIEKIVIAQFIRLSKYESLSMSEYIIDIKGRIIYELYTFNEAKENLISSLESNINIQSGYLEHYKNKIKKIKKDISKLKKSKKYYLKGEI